jgi:hypothetical protein
MEKLKLTAPCLRGVRGADAWGSGGWAASRGDRLHSGLDFIADPGDLVRSPCYGIVTRIGQCYADDPSFKLVEILHPAAWVRVLYVAPDVAPGDTVHAGTTPLGLAQDVASRYGAGMTGHVHLDVRMAPAVVLTGRGSVPTEKVWADPRLFFSD